MRSKVPLLRFKFLLLGLLAGCALPAASGRLAFPDGTSVQYAARTVETSAFNASTIVAVKESDGTEDWMALPGVSVAGGVSGTMSGIVQGLGTFGALCLATGNC